MEVYPSEASLLDIFNFYTACTVTLIDPDLAKGGHLYTIRIKFPYKKSHC